jgi:multidrug efflux pump subunit AcrB
VKEAVIAACLTAAMILLFLGSWRSTLIVAVSIPLSILTSICLLGFLGMTMNVMTLGGLALAVGILVDDATVTIENIHRNMHEGKPLRQAILDGAAQIATPTLVATLSICIVFVSVVFLTGPAKFLFTPLALAVVFAMLASYLLSRTLVPVMTMLMLRKEADLYSDHESEVKGDLFWRIHRAFNARFERFADNYGRHLSNMLNNRRRTIFTFGGFFVISACLLGFIGRDFFPSVDAGQIRLHVRGPSGLRVEDTAHLFANVEETIRQVIPKEELEMALDNVGLPASGINLAFTDSATIGPSDGEILISLKEGHKPTDEYVSQLRKKLHQDFPSATFFFQPADIVSQILNFGLPAPIDIQIVGRSPQNFDLAKAIEGEVRKVPGAADVHIHQVLDIPSIQVNVDRDRAQQLNLTQKDVASNMLLSLSGSGQAAPNYWLDPKTGVNYIVAVQTPTHEMDSLDALANTPIASNGTQDQLLRNVSSTSRGLTQQNINHYNVQPTYDIYVNVADRDLGGVTSDVQKIVDKYTSGKKLPRGTTVEVRGQSQSMNSSFVGLGTGIAFAIILVYLLMVVNFQTWIDPFIIITALPGAGSGILWMLFLTNTRFSVPSLMGAIMCIGVATANSILVVTFANDRRKEGDDALQAAFAAGRTRLRPVLMTALAMIIGMAPMALGLGEGGEQNAPLGRAVIGGLLVATFTTLFFVPTVYCILRKAQPEPEDEGEIIDSLPSEPVLEPSLR